jgi:aldehyde:ferredoxin oxidoreductase
MSRVMSGYTGRILRVDLTREQITEEHPSEDILRSHIGGVGLGAKFLYDEVPPGVEWNDPENRLILAAGPMNGCKVAGAGAFCVVSKGPLTNGAASSQANGDFGAYLKFSGFDTIVIQGKANRWLYLYVHNGTAELRDARDLRGKDTSETEELIKTELGKQKVSVFGIGPAGENLVKFAAIVGDKGHVAGHNGLGAVMGSKHLKAVAVARGKAAVITEDKARLSTLAREMTEEFKKRPTYQWGTSFLYSVAKNTGILPVKNLTTDLFSEEDAKKFTGQYYRSRFELIKWNPCWACSAHHCHTLKVTEGPYAGYIGEEPEFEAFVAWSSLIGQTDVGAAFMLSNLADRLGLEVNEGSWLIAFLMECFEKGIISDKDTDGLQMNWGNIEAVEAMLRKIANRQGFGDLLAEGLMRTAQKLGGEALNIGVYLKKGVAPRSHDHRAEWTQMFDVATSNTGTLETYGIKVDDPYSPEEVATATAKKKGVRIFVDSLVMCQMPTNTVFIPKIDHLVDMVNAVTGWDMTPEEATRSGVRTVNLLRAFGIRHGITPKVEAPSIRYSSEPSFGPAKGKSIAPYWEQMMDKYYKEMNWDRISGRPLPETLRSLGLDYVISDIW